MTAGLSSSGAWSKVPRLPELSHRENQELKNGCQHILYKALEDPYLVCM